MALRRGVGLVLILIGLATLVSLMGMAAALVFAGREPAIASNSALLLRVQGGLDEVEPTGLIDQFLETAPTLRTVIDSLRKAKVDDRVAGVILAPRGGAGLWAKVQEVRDAVLDFRRSGKPIVAYLEYGGDQEYYLATACDRIYLMPTSPLDLNGLATFEIFLRGTLDKIGAYPDLLHIGEYKTAANMFTEKGFTPAHREMSESLNQDLYEQLVRGIADGRKKTEADVRALLDEGPFLPEDALREGLVDDLAYEDQIDARMKSGVRSLETLEADEYVRVSPASLGLNRGPRLAVIYAVGTISTGESSFDSTQGAVIGSDTMVKYLRRAREDPSIRAIVLRIDSPGGSAIASDIIWREVQLARAVKPVVASMSDLAASGGYYIAMPAHVIVAQPSTLTGSIGVVMGKFVLGGTFNKLGATFETVSRGRHAEINSPVRPYSPAERAKVEEQLQATYDAFVEKAAQGRNTTPERIDSVAQGRVWTGRQGKAVGLVDDLGGLSRAIAIAKARARIEPDEEVELVIYPPRRTFFEIVSDPLGRVATRSILGALLGSEEARAVTSLAAPLDRFRRGEPLAIMPYVFVR